MARHCSPFWILLSSVLALASSSVSAGNDDGVVEIDLTVGEYDVQGADRYICTVVRLPQTPHKLVGIKPLADQKIVHHILLYGCNTPYQIPTDDNPNPVWDCFAHGTCQSGDTIIYGWGRNAPQLNLPEGVGFSVGDQTSIHYIVAQVHYLEQRPADDRSGVRLMLKPSPTPYAGGLIAFATGFKIPPQQQSVLVTNECCYQGHQPLTTFAMRVHTHTLGKSVYMNRELYDHSGIATLGQRSPQLPQGFVAVQQTMIWPGDKLKVTCDFNSSNMMRTVFAGSTHDDEMCNMYMMVYAPQPHIVMCSGDHFDIHESTPGNIPRAASFVSDPSPFWKPPVPNVEGNHLGDVTSVTIAPDGALWVLYRGSQHWDYNSFDGYHHMVDTTPIPEDVVVRMDPDTGALLSAFGSGLFNMPHSIISDADSNVWVVDAGNHQVFKFNSDGKLLMTVGKPNSPGNDKAQFCQPTQVAVLRDGSFFVSDGYCNNRVVYFDKDGKYLDEAVVPNGQVIHSVLVDECSTTVYALSRQDGTVYAFDYKQKMSMKGTWPLGAAGWVWSIIMGPYSQVLVLAWKPGKDAKLVNLKDNSLAWTIPEMKNNFPHDIALGAAPVAFTGAGDRLFALYVAPVCETGCGALRRYILMPAGVPLPSPEALQDVGPMAIPQRPAQGELPDNEAELAKQIAEQGTGAGAAGMGTASKGTPAKAKPPAVAAGPAEAEGAKEKIVGSFSHGGVGAVGAVKLPPPVGGKPPGPLKTKAPLVVVKPDKETDRPFSHGGVGAVQLPPSAGGKAPLVVVKPEEETDVDGKGEEEEQGEYDYLDPHPPAGAEVKGHGAGGKVPEAIAEGPGDSLEEEFDIKLDAKDLKLMEESHLTAGQVVSLLILALIVSALVAAVALHVVRKYVTPKPLYQPPASMASSNPKDIICSSIEDMLDQSRALDDDVETNYLQGGQSAKEWSKKARASGLHD